MQQFTPIERYKYYPHCKSSHNCISVPLAASCLLNAPGGTLVIRGVLHVWQLASSPGTWMCRWDTRFHEIPAAQANEELKNLGYIVKAIQMQIASSLTEVSGTKRSMSRVQLTTDWQKHAKKQRTSDCNPEGDSIFQLIQRQKYWTFASL